MLIHTSSVVTIPHIGNLAEGEDVLLLEREPEPQHQGPGCLPDVRHHLLVAHVRHLPQNDVDNSKRLELRLVDKPPLERKEPKQPQCQSIGAVRQAPRFDASDATGFTAIHRRFELKMHGQTTNQVLCSPEISDRGGLERKCTEDILYEGCSIRWCKRLP